VSFFVALGVVLFQFKKCPIKLDSEFLVTHSLLSWVVGLLGARVLFIFVEWKKFGSGYFSVFRPWEGGIVFLGGFLGGAIYWYFIFKKKNFPIRLGFSLLAPGLALAHAVGRVGCFLNGCCFGSFCELPIAVIYTNPQSAAPLNTPLYPVQILEAAMLIIICICLIFVNNRMLLKKPFWKFDGVSFYLFSYGLGRFFLEFLRGDLHRGYWGPLSTSQWISMGMVGMGFCLKFLRR
jgi:phosphatidylglycerol:prolipoprotein diacylglycerol transferase